VIEGYRSWLPVHASTPVVSLGEGGTPLIHSERLSAETGARVYLKFEGANPTGSFKDRGMTVAVSKAVEAGSQAVLCASTGNTSASAAAYAAKAGLTCGVLVPRGRVAPGKLAQTVAHGATVIEIDGNFDEAFRVVRELAGTSSVTLVNSVNPDRLQGQKTLAFEVCDALGSAPDVHIVPVGNAGNITSHWLGYREYGIEREAGGLPAMVGVQAEGAAPLVRGERVEHPDTVATAIRIGSPASWEGAVGAAVDSGGEFLAVPDDQILSAQRRLMRQEGLFVEPASAASVAGLLALFSGGRLSRRALVVCVLTGHGLKDPDWGTRDAAPMIALPADATAIAERLGLSGSERRADGRAQSTEAAEA
jgi:threonine synthase